MPLRIPTKTLDDNYKLSDFQNDYTMLYDLYTKPVNMDFDYTNNSIKVLNESGRTIVYILHRQNGMITKIHNSTDNITTNINRGGFR